MSTRAVVRLCAAGAAIFAAALLAGAHRPEPMTCSVTSVTVAKYIGVEAQIAGPSTSLQIEVEPHGPHGSVFTHGRPVVTSVTDEAGKEILRAFAPNRPMPRRPATAREEVAASVRSSVQPQQFQPPMPAWPFYLDSFPSVIQQLKGHVDVMTGEEAVVPLEIGEGKGAVEVSPGVTFTVTKVTEFRESRSAAFEIRIRKNRDGDGSALEPVVAALVQRKNGKEMPAPMHLQLRERETAEEYIITGPSLGLGEAGDTSWALRLIRDIRRTTVEFECQDVVVRPG
jgi:hypothetical protein